MEPDDVPQDAVTSGRMLIVDCHETAGVDPGARGTPARPACRRSSTSKRCGPGIADLLQNIDAIIAARGVSRPRSPATRTWAGRSRSWARDFGAPLVCVTLGEEGSLAWCNGREIRTPAFQVDCVDSTGAGDVVPRRVRRRPACAMPDGDIEDVLTYANAAAALNCRALGSRGGLPTADEVDQLVACSVAWLWV